MVTALAVLLAGFLHAVWNALAKAVPDRYTAFAIIGLASAVVGLPLALTGLPAAAAWPYLLASVVIHVVYTLLLARSYTLGDFSQVYPVARGSAPLVVALIATLLGERLSGTRLVGLAAVCGGLGVLALVGQRAAPSWRALGAALATGLSIAAYTVVDGLGVRVADGAVGYTAWLFLVEGTLVVAGVVALRGRRVLDAPCEVWAMSATGGVISMLAYGIVIWAQTRGALAEIAALRETGVIWGAVIGVLFFGERMGPRRVAAAVVVAGGVVLLNLHHT
ncbi:EamA-like transporter family protein [Actinocorallia herbida]|uniref:EamA-like transporter family protein n=1 Tax=Actinocorallia herbida TaxID=58109 RepID=A0A3N1CWL1_9ACTN|nr:DMT family transporter [Actinocorallia herbida]ROO85689.1 EamA-like transporter family protein [Actinocorallia herbida]